VPLPPFDVRGLLPPFNGDPVGNDRSPYFCTMSELCTALGTTPHRCDLLRKLIAYRALIGGDDYVAGVQFIDGSFVENIELVEARNPNDIDVFSILLPPAKYVNNPPIWASNGLPFWQSEIADNPKNKQRFSVDSYAMMLDTTQPGHFLRQALYWYSLFSHKRGNHEWKGFVAVSLNAADDQAALALMGGP
jgi:hypothetical protein